MTAPKRSPGSSWHLTGRQRLEAVLRKQPEDRRPWTTLVDKPTRSLLADELRGNGGSDFYKHVGCDIFPLSGWNTPQRFRSPEFRWFRKVRVSRQRDGNRVTTVWEAPKGVLTRIWERSHSVKYPVDPARFHAVARWVEEAGGR